ncbi:class I SAM-dependent methyltransferase [Rhodopila globiformis]|nr:class I SAM-dependent methyltransferase [Rhodopila globiformis]
MTSIDSPSHDHVIVNQFTRQAAGFAARPELHAHEVLQLIVEAAAPGRDDRAIDLACGPGSVACALAERAAHVVGLDSTPAMLGQARALAANRNLSNVAWMQGSIYAAPFDDGSFAAVTCRFAFHHLEDPARAFAEMVRLTAPGGRIVLCDGLASDDPAKAFAFNAMERRRDPSTVAFRTLGWLCGLFVSTGLGEPAVRMFQVPYLAADLVNGSFPEWNDRRGLLDLIECSVGGDTLGMGARETADGVRIAYRSAVLSAIKTGPSQAADLQ